MTFSVRRSAARQGGQSNIYTVLALIAAVALLIGVAYVGYKNVTLTGSSNPFHVVESGL
ncbi:MAG: hypothetical protein IT442_06630 [Phycisphaeraceae bacterium]|nr:hypothetical protein [Phycisphaeraceae bacterium]